MSKKLRSQTNAPVLRVLLEYPAVDDTLVDPLLLEALLRDIAALGGVSGLFEEPEVELALARDVIGYGFRLGLQGRVVRGVEDLRCSATVR